MKDSIIIARLKRLGFFIIQTHLKVFSGFSGLMCTFKPLHVLILCSSQSNVVLLEFQRETVLLKLAYSVLAYREWDKELYKWRTGGRPQLWKALGRCYGRSIAAMGVMLLSQVSACPCVQAVTCCVKVERSCNYGSVQRYDA